MMLINSSHAAIDNDFLLKLSTVKISEYSNEVLLNIFNKIFKSLGVIPIIHPLVLKHETIINRDSVEPLFNNKLVLCPTKEDITKNDSGRSLFYENVLSDLYLTLTDEPFPFQGKDIWVKWNSGKSFGEVHSVTMCLLCGCSIFLSDDEDSKELQKIVSKQQIGNILVLNRSEAISKLPTGTFNRKTRSALTHK